MLRDVDRIFALRRHATGWMDGHFSLPAGGVENGETLAQAAVREAQEEIGVIIDPGDVQLTHVMHARTHQETWTGYFFNVTRWRGNPTICEPEKHDHPCWGSLNELPEPTVPYVREALKAIHAGDAYSEYGWSNPERT